MENMNTKINLISKLHELRQVKAAVTGFFVVSTVSYNLYLSKIKNQNYTKLISR